MPLTFSVDKLCDTHVVEMGRTPLCSALPQAQPSFMCIAFDEAAWECTLRVIASGTSRAPTSCFWWRAMDRLFIVVDRLFIARWWLIWWLFFIA